jgi:hypothetical protein
MSRLATVSTAFLLALLCLGASDASLPPPMQTVIEVEICKRPYPGRPPTCGPTKRYTPVVGDVTARNPKINCPELDCEGPVTAGVRLRIMAKATRDPALGEYRFVRWTGPCAGEPEVCEVPAPRRRRVTMRAFFAPEG